MNWWTLFWIAFGAIATAIYALFAAFQWNTLSEQARSMRESLRHANDARHWRAPLVTLTAPVTVVAIVGGLGEDQMRLEPLGSSTSSAASR